MQNKYISISISIYFSKKGIVTEPIHQRINFSNEKGTTRNIYSTVGRSQKGINPDFLNEEEEQRECRFKKKPQVHEGEQTEEPSLGADPRPA